jgi:hypothetical protein
VNYGILPGQLDGRLLAAEKQAKDREMMLKKEAAVAAAAGGDTANDGSDQKKRGAGSGTVASDPTPIVYYDGGVLVEVRDYRDGRGIFDPATSTVKPVAFKMFLREDSHSLFQFLDQDAKKFHRTRIAIEIASIMQRFPSVCLDPDPTAHKIASIINYNNNKYNIPVKANAARQRRRLVPVRRGPRFAPTIGAPMPPRPLPTPTKSHPPPPAPTSRLLSFLQQANHSSITQETLEKQQMKPSGSEKNCTSSSLFTRVSEVSFADLFFSLRGYPAARRHYLPVPKDPDSNYGPKEAVPRIAGRYHFVMPVPTRPQQQQQPGQPPQPQPPGQVSDFIILEIKGSGTPPYEMYIASLRVGLTAKPVTLALGGPTAAQQFLNQFMKLETAASPEHLKMLQTLQQQAQQAQARAQQAAQQGPGGAPAQQGGNTTPQGAPGAQQGQAGTPTQPSAGTAKQAVPPLTIPSGGNGLNRPMPSPTGAPLAGQMFAGQPKQALPPGVQRAPSQPGGPMPTQTLPQPGGPATPTPPPLVSGLQNLRPAGGGTLPPHPNLKFNPGVPKGGPSPQQMALARNQQMSQHMNRPMGAGPYPPSAQPGAFPVAGQPKLAQQNPGMVAPTQPPMMQQQQPPTQQPVPLGAPGAQHLVGQQPIAAQPQTPPSSRPTTRQSSSKKRG